MRLVNRVITRDASKMAVGQVYYTPWCDEDGKVIDDGTVTRLSEQVFRWTAADPNLRWLTENSSGLDVAIEDISETVAALALQGPTSARLLREVCDADLSTLKYFRATSGHIAGVPVDISRTGYTGDLGYEIWMPWDAALQVWDAIASAGRAFDLHPTGMLALDIARIEAGLLLIDVDFHSSRKALIESQKYTPHELGLGRLVDLKKGAFVGRAAIAERSEARRRAADRRPRGRLDGSGEAVRRGRPAADRAGGHVARGGAGLQGPQADRPRHVDDLVVDSQEADRAGDHRRAALQRGHAGSKWK